MSRTVRVGVIGLGFMGATHVRAYQDAARAGLPCELVAVAEDPDHCRALEALRDTIFEIREEIVNLRKELKEN